MNSLFFEKIKKFVFYSNDPIANVLILVKDETFIEFFQIRELCKLVKKVVIANDNMFFRNRVQSGNRGIQNLFTSGISGVKDKYFDLIVIQSIDIETLYFLNKRYASFKYVVSESKITEFETRNLIKFSLVDDNTIFNEYRNAQLIPDFSIDKRLAQKKLLNGIGSSSTDEAVKLKASSQSAKDDLALEKKSIYKAEGSAIDASFFVVNYNTSKLINLLIRSIHKYVKSIKYDIWVFDNSDKEALTLDELWPDVHILDNSNGQLINYEKELNSYTDVKKYSKKFNDFISLKHSLAIQYGLNCNLINDNFILCDSDIILIKDIAIINDSCVAAGIFEEKQRRLC